MKKTGCDRTPNPIFVRHAGGLKSISTDSIVYMEANACKSFFYLNDGSVVQVEMPLNPTFTLRHYCPLKNGRG